MLPPTSARRSLSALGTLIGILWLGLGPMSVRALARDDTPTRIQTRPDDRAIRLRSGAFVPPLGIDLALKERVAADGVGRRHFMIQIHDALRPEEREAMESAGLRLLTPIRENGWFVSAPSAASLSHAAIRWAGDFLPGDRVDPRLASESDVPEFARAGAGLVRVSVATFRDVSPAEALAKARPFDPLVTLQGPHHLSLVVPREVVPRLESEDFVMWIEPSGAPLELLNDLCRIATHAEEVQNMRIVGMSPVYDFNGSGVQVAVFDTGVDATHLDFAGRIIRMHDPNHFHGTAVAGVLGGSGFNSNRNGNGGSPFQWRGMAPGVGIAAFYASMSSADYDEAINVFGVDLTTNSFVQDVACNYGIEAMDLDSFVRGNVTGTPGRTIHAVFGAGNNGSFRQYGDLTGYFSTFTSAKNTISVGATNSDDDTLTYFSSMGPTFDGRLKPDVMAPGCSNGSGVTSTDWPGGGYSTNCGTSLSAPCCSGVASLVLENYVRTYGVDLDSSPPLPSTLKAILIQTATDLSGTISTVNPDTGAPVSYFPGPDFATGWGLINARAAVDLVSEKRLREMSVPSTGAERTLKIDVPSGQPLKVTIAWDDEPGNPAESNELPKLVNDLDLTLVAPNSITHLPWSLAPLPHEPYDGSLTGIDPIAPGNVVPAGRGPDHLNNVEQVVVAAPQSGRWTVRVRGFNLASEQAFSIAANVSVKLFDLVMTCDAVPDSNGLLGVTASLENLSNVAHPIRVALSFVDCDGSRLDDVRVYSRTIRPNGRPSRTLRVAVPGSLDSGCDLRLEIAVTTVATGAREAFGACMFRKP